MYTIIYIYIQTGMLATKDIIQCVVEAIQNRNIPLIVDPVMVATSGDRYTNS